MTGVAESDGRARALILPGGKVDPEAVRLSIGGVDAACDASSEDVEGICRVTFRLSHDLDKRLDKYLTDRIHFLSRNQLQRLIDEGGVTVNGRRPKASQRLRRGDVVVAALPPPPATEIQPEAIPLDILYEDEAIIVVNKQAGLIVHPARAHLHGTLLNALVHHFSQVVRASSPPQRPGLSSVGKEFARPGVVHRLDRYTTGVMVVAKDDTAHWRLGRQFEERTVEKRYLAIVHGIVEADADVIDAPLGDSVSRVKGRREKQQVRYDEHGREAVTICRVRQRFFPSSPADAAREAAIPPGPFSLVELELKTGRTHQVRLHMSHIGHPLVGDDMYGGKPVDLGPGEGAFARQALHAALLRFTHPMTRERMTFAAPLPPDMAGLLALLRGRGGASAVLHVPGSEVNVE